MSCSTPGVSHLVSFHAEGRMRVEDARAIYHQLIREHESNTTPATDDDSSLEGQVATLTRIRNALDSAPQGSIRADRAGAQVSRLITALESGQMSTLRPAEMRALTSMPAAIATAVQCEECGQFMAAGGQGHRCPETRRRERTPQRRFGVEMEFGGLYEDDAEEVSRALPRPWQVKEDCSVETGSGYGLEVASPIMRGDLGFNQVVEMGDGLLAAGAEVDETCGVHVHVDMRDFTIDDLSNLVGMFHSQQDALYAATGERSSASYCEAIPEAYVQRVQSTLQQVKSSLGEGGEAAADEAEPPTTMQPSGLPRWNYRATGWRSNLTRQLLGVTHRYRGLNLQSIAAHNTVEYRLHQGSLDGVDVSNWARFCVAFTEAARRPALVDAINSQPNNMKHTTEQLVGAGLLSQAAADQMVLKAGELEPVSVPAPRRTIRRPARRAQTARTTVRRAAATA
jgi:Putative amidoligase enzyme